MKVISLLEGVFHVDAKKEFHYLGDDIDVKNPDDGYNLIVRPFLIQVGEDNILIDCGFGTEVDCEPIILRKLREHNINPNQITKVLISHLHKDHINGIGSWVGEQFVCNFPEAKIYIQQREYDYAVAQTNNSYNYERLEKLKSFKNIVWMNDENSGFVSKNI